MGAGEPVTALAQLKDKLSVSMTCEAESESLEEYIIAEVSKSIYITKLDKTLKRGKTSCCVLAASADHLSIHGDVFYIRASDAEAFDELLRLVSSRAWAGLEALRDRIEAKLQAI